MGNPEVNERLLKTGCSFVVLQGSFLQVHCQTPSEQIAIPLHVAALMMGSSLESFKVQQGFLV